MVRPANIGRSGGDKRGATTAVARAGAHAGGARVIVNVKPPGGTGGARVRRAQSKKPPAQGNPIKTQGMQPQEVHRLLKRSVMGLRARSDRQVGALRAQMGRLNERVRAKGAKVASLNKRIAQLTSTGVTSPEVTRELTELRTQLVQVNASRQQLETQLNTTKAETDRLGGAIDVLKRRGIVFEGGVFHDISGRPMLNPDGKPMTLDEVMFNKLSIADQEKVAKRRFGVKEEESGKKKGGETAEEKDAKGTAKFAKDTENIAKGVGNINMGLGSLFSAGAFANILMVIVIILLIWIVMRVFFPMIP